MEKSIECTNSRILEQISQTRRDIYQTSDQTKIVGTKNGGSTFPAMHYVHFVKYDDTVSFYDTVSDTIRRRGGYRGMNFKKCIFRALEQAGTNICSIG